MFSFLKIISRCCFYYFVYKEEEQEVKKARETNPFWSDVSTGHRSYTILASDLLPTGRPMLKNIHIFIRNANLISVQQIVCILLPLTGSYNYFRAVLHMNMELLCKKQPPSNKQILLLF